LIKNSQPFEKKFQKTVGGIFFDSHCSSVAYIGPYLTLPYGSAGALLPNTEASSRSSASHIKHNVETPFMSFKPQEYNTMLMS